MTATQWHPLVAPLFTSGLLAAAIAVYGWRRGTAVARSFGLLMAAVTWWSLSYAGELMSHSLPHILVWIKIEYPGIVTTPVFFFLFALTYSGRGHGLTRPRLAALFLIPLVVLLLVWTLPHHRLYYADWGLVQAGRYVVFYRAPGVGYQLFTASSYLLVVGGLGLLAQMFLASPPHFRPQVAVVFVGALLPWLANVGLNLLGPTKSPVDPTPLAFAISGVPIGYSLRRLGFLDILPAARSALVDSIEDAWIVLDSRGRIVDLNAAARSLVGGAAPAGARPAQEVLAAWPEILTLIALNRDAEIEANPAQGMARDLSVRQMLLHDTAGATTGRLVVLHEVTEQKQLERRQEHLIAELQSALSEIRALSGLLPICSQCHKIRDDEGYWHRVEEYIEQHSQAQFTHGICPECLRELYPQISAEQNPDG